MSAHITTQGTLVIAIPSNAGLVVAADSRTTATGLYCDDKFKILVPTKSKRVIATVTGTGTILRAPDQPIHPSNICEYIRTGVRLLDIESLVRTHLENSDGTNIDGLMQSCLGAVYNFSLTSPNSLQQYRGQEMFSVVFASYDPDSRASAARGFVIGINQEPFPFVAQNLDFARNSEERQDYWLFGETNYFDKHVLHGIGRQFLSKETMNFYTNAGLIRDLTFDEATALATDILHAAARTTDIVSPPSGIGGAIDVVLLGKNERPKLVKWKSQ